MQIKLKVTGKVHALIENKETGLVTFNDWLGGNVVVTTGLQHIADQLLDSPAQGTMSHMAVGNQVSPTPAAVTDTALESELDRNTLTSKTRDGKKVIFVGTWAAGDGTGDLTEAGIFNAASAGVMLCRKTFDTRPKGASDSLTLTWELTFS